MGYDVHITRKDEWFSEEGEEISLKEWTDFVNSSSDMRLKGFAEAKTPSGTLRIESEGLSVWLDNSGHDEDGIKAWFGHAEGNIEVKSPDEEILKKMFQIAQVFDAKVQGDEGEIYDKDGNSNWQALRANDEIAEATPIKKWWQFWK